MTELTTAAELAVPFETLQPYEDHVHPIKAHQLINDRKPDSRRIGSPVVAANFVARENQAIQKGLLDNWDYVLRKLFVQKATSLERAIE
jgi:mitochondrial transcription factor 1